MSNTIFITANWTTGALSQQTISRQYDNNRYAVQFIGYPEGDGTEELDLYLLVWMSTAPGQKPGEITPIQLNSDQWYISNYFTQQVQVIKFQLCVLNEAGTYEAHSPIFSGRIGDSLEHDGTSQDIDVSTLFDAYREYVEELIIGAGAVIIDPVPTQGSTNAVQSGGVYSALVGKVDTETGKGLSTNDYSDAEKQKVTDATADLTAMTTATAEDVGKALKAKTVTDGKVVEWEFSETGASGNYVEYASKQSGELSPTTVDKTDSVTGKLNYSTGVIGTGTQTISNFIDISKTTRFYRSSNITTKYLSDIYCLYDENYNYLAGFDGNTSYTFETIDNHANCIRYNLSTPGAHYMRTQFNTFDAFTYYKVDTYDIYDTEIKEVRDARTDYNDVEQDSLADALDASYTAIKGEFSDVADEISDLKGFESAGTAELVCPYNSAKSVKLTANASMTLGVHGITVADSDHMGTVTYSNIEEVTSYTGKGKKYRITALGTSGNTYRVSGTASGLTIGKTYRICLKVTDSQNDSSGGGHYAQVLCKSSVKSLDKTVSEEHVYTTTFVATATTQAIYIYPFQTNGSGYTQAVGDEFVIEDWYINEVNGDIDLFTHEGCFSESVTGTELEYTLNGKMFVATGDGASVYITHMPSKLLTVNNTEPDADGDVTVKSHLQDKTIVCFGDSITNKGYGEYFDYPYISSEITGANTINAGIGGTSMRYRTNHNTWNMASFANMADMIVSGDFSDIATLGTTSGFEKADRCKELAPILEAIDWNDVDIITLAYGANDFETSTAVNHLDDSEDADDKYTYIGAFRYALNTVLAEYPHIQFLVLTPVFRFWTVDGVILNSDERTFEDINGTIHYYTWGDALKTCAQNEYHTPVCDLYRELGVNGVNYTWFSTDGVHPDEEGLIRMGNHIASALISKF